MRVQKKDDTERLRLPPNPSSTLLDDSRLSGGSPLTPSISLTAPLGAEAFRSGAQQRKDHKIGTPTQAEIQKAKVNGVSGFEHFKDAILASQSNRQIAICLADELKDEIQGYNKVWGKRDEQVPLVEFSLAAAHAAFEVCDKFLQAIVHQVSKQCQEQGAVLGAVWRSYTSLLENLLGQIRQQSSELRTRLDTVEGQQEARRMDLLEEIDILKVQIRKLQTSGPGERLSMRKSLMPSDLAEILAAVGKNGGSMSSKRPAVVRFQASAEESEGRAGPRGSDDTPPLVPTSHANETGSWQAPSAPRPGSIAASLPSGNRRASVVAGNLLKQLQVAEAEAEDNDMEYDDDGSQSRINSLKKQLEDCRSELFEVYSQVASLEAVADEVVNLESRLETAEEARDAAVEKARIFTPRPEPSFQSSAVSLSDEAADLLSRMIVGYRNWPSIELASMLLGIMVREQPVMASARGLFACLQAPLLEDQIARSAVVQALQDNALKPLGSFLTQHQLSWLEDNVPGLQSDCQSLATFLTGISGTGYEYPEEHYGSLALIQQDLSLEAVSKLILTATMPTRDRVSVLEEENRILKAELVAFHEAAAQQAELELKAARSKQLKEEEAKFEKPNPLDVYLDMLAASDEASIKEGLLGMGSGADIPKIFRSNAKVRNKQMSKRETEKMIKEIWKDKVVEMKAGKHTDMAEFIFQYLQKRLGITNAVVEAGYNLLYSVWKYSFDADCNLFLKVLKGDIKEDVYLQQINLQVDLDQLFMLLDRSVHPVETGTIPKTDVYVALESYFKVGEQGGKTRERFDALMQALDADQKGPIITYKSVFEEDREYNQGEFAETVREQFLAERVEYFKELQRLLYAEASTEESATKQMLVRALCKCDPDLGEKQAWTRTNEVFAPGADRHSIKLLMKRLQAGAVKRDRSSSAAMSFSSMKPAKAGKGLMATMTKQKPKVSTAIQDAVDAVRLKAAGGKAATQTGHQEDGLSTDAVKSGLSDKASAGTLPRQGTGGRPGPSPLSHQQSS